ncbi:MAG TPA: hypothetical protein VNH11_00825 [Pirellulales bacterium]|nr:hypothetical protein [Pirellulales bacterium]
MGLFVAACLMLATPGEVPQGCSSSFVEAGRARIEVFTYKPETFDGGPMIVVCHGMLRNADEYRDHARSLADRLGALVVAPLFPTDDFPYERYQAGGLLDEGRLAPRDAWTWQLLLELINEMRRREDRPDMPYYLFGHSGGAQFLVRMAGFITSDAQRIVVSNPGALLFPSRELPYPYGFGGLPEEVSDDAALSRFLAQPLTLYIAEEDCERDEFLDVTDSAELQGANRRQRSANAFRAARHLALENGWKFNWQLVIVPGVAHDHQKMLDHDLCERALHVAATDTRHSATRRPVHFSLAAKTRRNPLRKAHLEPVGEPAKR